jgi:hypothetical protein
MTNYESIDQLKREIKEKEVAHRREIWEGEVAYRREIDEKEVAYQQEKKLNQKRLKQMRNEVALIEKNRSIEILNFPVSLIPLLESQLKNEGNINIPYGTRFLEYKIADILFFPASKTVFLELDRVPDLQSLIDKLKIHEFAKVSLSESPKQIRAEFLQKTAESDYLVEEILV